MSKQVIATDNCEWCNMPLEELGSPSCKELCVDCTEETSIFDPSHAWNRIRANIRLYVNALDDLDGYVFDENGVVIQDAFEEDMSELRQVLEEALMSRKEGET